MPQVFIPSLMRDLTGGEDMVVLGGETLREVIGNLEERFPGIGERVLYDDTRIMPGLAVAIDGEITEDGLRTVISVDSEIHFVAAISGGMR